MIFLITIVLHKLLFRVILFPYFGVIQHYRHNFQNLSYFIRLELHHTYKSSLKYFILHRKSINISKYQRQMQILQQIDTKLTKTVPYYS
jgi:hypothetical protein